MTDPAVEMRALRARLDLTQEAAAAFLDVSAAAVRHWEAGRRPVPAPVLMLLRRQARSGKRPAGAGPPRSRPWSEADLAVLRSDLTHRQAAARVGRSPAAVAKRRERLRREAAD